MAEVEACFRALFLCILSIWGTTDINFKIIVFKKDTMWMCYFFVTETQAPKKKVFDASTVINNLKHDEWTQEA